MGGGRSWPSGSLRPPLSSCTTISVQAHNSRENTFFDGAIQLFLTTLLLKLVYLNLLRSSVGRGFFV